MGGDPFCRTSTWGPAAAAASRLQVTAAVTATSKPRVAAAAVGRGGLQRRAGREGLRWWAWPYWLQQQAKREGRLGQGRRGSLWRV
ncbi:hypothetical protein PAHAL_5G051900 [Panicum hallii]|uniref:Uncharacterized protein n=1 Tax=Panicum hallii TaxID=206008 RepID=A0A2T8IJ14_9POAL|nr:hypothetical protein PAHAL_5G051900 [Panicum hallii]